MRKGLKECRRKGRYGEMIGRKGVVTLGEKKEGLGSKMCGKSQKKSETASRGTKSDSETSEIRTKDAGGGKKV